MCNCATVPQVTVVQVSPTQLQVHVFSGNCEVALDAGMQVSTGRSPTGVLQASYRRLTGLLRASYRNLTGVLQAHYRHSAIQHVVCTA